MILVDRCRPCGAPWAGGVACHLMSDEGVGELLDFAERIRLPMAWFQHRATVPHFDLTPGWRKKAVAAGAQTCDRREYVEGIQRWRSRNPN